MWQQIKILLEPQDCPALEELLLARGAAAVSYLDAADQAVFQELPGATTLWDHTCMLCLFDGGKDLDALLRLLSGDQRVKNRVELLVEELADQPWERAWMAQFHPRQYGEKLWIVPSSQTPPDTDAINILLDPGLAFGTGSHPTTALCLRWLEQAKLTDCRVIDYGCGSGVLAIAAALLGAEKVYAVDHDPQAILATQDNSRRNGLDDARVMACLPDALPTLAADVLIANILAEPLLELAPDLAQLIRPGGLFAMSGLLHTQVPTLCEHYQRWFQLAEPQVEEEWVLLSGTRTGDNQ